ncbi:helix-turn-helix domain-containing protein [Shewanella sp. GD04112]|uniref:helix-turn-helix transcriptional regulator n=1 Tax=Shewanella sp. GD04112 TaxID=2975434 RepID=UPI0024492216|nr:helix-turn-helix domain-containing protein [Shewanella sp. GD04112]MDH0448829.1 helix-turn-helix domain-containing protein [Shewanella sp. GD04112]
MICTPISYPSKTSAQTFSNFLKHTRTENQLSQEELCCQLRQKSCLFDTLDAITISRWERGVNIPSLAKQAEIVEIFGSELFDIYREDKTFIHEGLSLINLFESSIERSEHPYYRNKPYRVEFIDSQDDNFMTLLQLSLVYESNPRLSLTNRQLTQPFICGLSLVVAFSFGEQIVGHSLFCRTQAKVALEFMNDEVDLFEVIGHHSQSIPDTLMVFSSFGVTPHIENYMMSVYLHKMALSRSIKYLSFSICDEALKRKLTQFKLPLFKIRTLDNYHKPLKNYSFFASRTEVMANRNLLKLSVIPSAKSQTIDPIFFMQLGTSI